jgi:hypothetical protein
LPKLPTAWPIEVSDDTVTEVGSAATSLTIHVATKPRHVMLLNLTSNKLDCAVMDLARSAEAPDGRAQKPVNEMLCEKPNYEMPNVRRVSIRAASKPKTGGAAHKM